MAKKAEKTESAKNKNTEAAKNPANEYLKFYIFLAVLAFAVYFNSLQNDFVFDDESVVLGDPSITDIKNLPKYFTGEEGFHKVIGRYYRPVVSASYAIDYMVWGPKAAGFHFTNILIHLINTLLVFKLLMLLFKNVQHKYKTYFLFFGAALFALHPIHTEAVSWVSGRTDSLFFTFFAAAFIYYLKFKEESTNKNLLMLSLYYFLSLLSKEMAITLPVVIILYEFIINQKNKLADFAQEKKAIIYMAAVSVLFLFIRWLILKDVPVRESYYYFYGKSFATVFFTMLQAIPVYFKLILVPYGMLYHYSGNLPFIDSIARTEAIFAIAIIAILLFSAFYLRKRLPWLSFSIFFIFLTLAPVLNIVPTMNFIAERFIYLPSLALSFAAVALAIKYYSPKRNIAIFSLCGIFVIGYVYLTYTRNMDWKTNDTLFWSAEGKPGTITYVNIGNMYANKQEFDRAEIYFRKAIDLRKETILANNNLGKIFMIKGDNDSAYFYMYRAYTLDTLSPEPMHSIGTLLANNDKTDEAIMWFQKIKTINLKGYLNSNQQLDDLLKTRNNSGNVNLKMTKTNDIMELEKSSYQFYQKKEYAKAIEVLNKLIEKDPANNSNNYNNMGMCYLDQNDLNQAKNFFEKSIESNKSFTPAYSNLAATYIRIGDKQKAKENYNKVLELDPHNDDVKSRLKLLQ